MLKEAAMNRNVGIADRLIRAVAGAVGIGLAISGTIGVWGYLGFVPLVTSVVGTCPLYTLLQISTRSRDV